MAVASQTHRAVDEAQRALLLLAGVKPLAAQARQLGLRVHAGVGLAGAPRRTLEPKVRAAGLVALPHAVEQARVRRGLHGVLVARGSLGVRDGLLGLQVKPVRPARTATLASGTAGVVGYKRWGPGGVGRGRRRCARACVRRIVPPWRRQGRLEQATDTV